LIRRMKVSSSRLLYTYSMMGKPFPRTLTAEL
jgi:hypothetical protein